MTKILTLDEMLEALREIKHPRINEFTAAIQSLGQDISDELAAFYGIEAGECRSDSLDVGGTCACFYAKSEDQKWPQAFEDYDSEGDWEPRSVASLPPAGTEIDEELSTNMGM